MLQLDLILLHTHHYHVICEQCGKIVDFHYPGLDEVEHLASHVTGFKVSNHRIEIYGYLSGMY